MAFQLPVPPPPKEYTKQYIQFRGVDFSVDPSQVDSTRSPDAVNVIADGGGFPEKRTGWRTLLTLPGRINGIYHITIENESRFVAHAGTELYEVFTDERPPQLLKEGIHDARNSGIVFGGKLWLLTGGDYLTIGMFEEEFTCKAVAEFATVPTTFIGRAPSGGGTRLQPVNLLTPKRINEFLGDGTTKVYQLDGTPIDETPLTVKVGGVEKAEGTDYTVNHELGQVTFTTAPPKDTSGIDNVSIEYARTVAGYADKIPKCTICAQYGVGTTDRIFFSGNPDSRNLDWHSQYNDPAFVGDTSFAVVGSEENAIMGYLRIGDNLAIVKEDNQQDSTIFFRSYSIANDGAVAFPMRQGVQSVGAVSKYCLGSLRDDPVFLSKGGVYAITTVTYTLERAVKNRSQSINARLTRESGLDKAIGVMWRDWFVICVNERCYVADSKQKTEADDSFAYEWYFWDNIPARCFLELGEQLYFGTENGQICVFKSSGDKMSKYSDDGAPIRARWSTKADDDGDFMRYKTVPRRGSGILTKPYTSSSVKISFKTEKDFGRMVKGAGMSIFDFSDLDFSNLSFNTSDSAQAIPINAKAKKYQTLQIIVENNEVNQGFGVLGIIKRYRIGGYNKG